MKKSIFKNEYYVDLLLVLVTVIWGIKPTIIKIGLFDISAVQYNVWRVIFATGASWIFLGISGEHKVMERKDIKNILFISVCGFFIFQWFYGIGIGKTTAGNSSIIMGTLPMLVALINHITGFEKMNKIRVLGILTSFIGLILVILGTGTGVLLTENIAGGLYIFTGALGYANYMIFSKSLTIKYSPKQITAYAITISAVLIILFSGFDINLRSMNISLLFSLLFSGVIAMFLANYLWTWAIQRSSSGRVAIYNNLTPVFSVISASIVLKEDFTTVQFLGTMIIFLGLYISIYVKYKKKII